jgi:uncharacterized protein
VTLEALRQELAAKGELRLKVKVVPRARRSALAGFLADGTLKVRIQAPPEKGKANEELRILLARELGTDPRQVLIVHGDTSPSKHVRILV